MTGKEKVRFGFGARRRGFFLGEDRRNRRDRRGPSRVFSTPRVCAPVDRGPGRDDARPVAAADDAGLCATRRFGSDRIETRVRRVARCLDARSAG